MNGIEINQEVKLIKLLKLIACFLHNLSAELPVSIVFIDEFH